MMTSLMKSMVVGLLTLLVQTTPQPSTSDPQPKEFASADEAATHALQFVARISEAYELGGVILRKPDGKYTVGMPHTDYRGDAVEIDQDPDDYNGTIVATYHTHPCLPVSHIPTVFSPADLSEARAMNHPAYMADLCSGDVHRWSPGDGYDAPPNGNPVAVLFAPQLSHGAIIGHITVTTIDPIENYKPGDL